MTRLIKVGPFGVYFTNINTAMNLPGHGHYAEVVITFETTGPKGFPAFASTYQVIQDKLIAFTRNPFRNCTNEDVADKLFEAFDGWSDPVIDSWNGEWKLDAVTLRVRGVPDTIGHADGFTEYSVARSTKNYHV